MNQQFTSIHPEAKIGKDVEIGPFVTIDKDVVIGDGTKIMSGAVILEGTRIGCNCRIFPHAVLGAVPQDLKGRRSVNTADEALSRAKKLWKRRIFRSLPSTATKEPSATAIHPTPTCVYT